MARSSNKNLRQANKAKKDEFYTQLSDIEKELKYYKDKFKGKVVYCNADDPFESNFFKYFASNFNVLGLKKLIATSYAGSPVVGGQLSLFDVEGLKIAKKKEPHKIEINEVKDLDDDGAVNMADVEWLLKHDKNVATPLKGDGDFRSVESIKILKEADIIVTNPPFSLFREYVMQLMKYKKKFLIIGNINAVSYRDIFTLLKENKLWLGASIHSGDREFRVPDYYPLNAAGYRVDSEGNKYIRVKGVRWFTNLDYKERHEDLLLYKKYYGNEEEFPKYDHYDAINVDVTKDIPMDYKKTIGVPITFVDKYNPDQFEIIDGIGRYSMLTGSTEKTKGTYLTKINGKPKYARVIIKNKKVTK
ncbi:MAG: adenine-specific methyltransferase EcoRI family protein [Candidatus Pacebacteria bacterium]|nr:adenine-specific methyltransferase EcoRI family protein [Candidatus Paceibacterota bacterium]